MLQDHVGSGPVCSKVMSVAVLSVARSCQAGVALKGGMNSSSILFPVHMAIMHHDFGCMCLLLTLSVFLLFDPWVVYKSNDACSAIWLNG